jgi:F420-dependent methylenetetrahydromethanopterin dehydrogenase
MDDWGQVLEEKLERGLPSIFDAVKILTVAGTYRIVQDTSSKLADLIDSMSSV